MDFTQIQYPQLGPRTEMGEFKLEQYNRALVMVKNLQKRLNPTKWRLEYTSQPVGTSTNVSDQSTRIGIEHVPLWMQPRASREAFLNRTRVDQLPRMTFQL